MALSSIDSFLISGKLILSLGQVLSLPTQNQALWFSREDTVVAQALPQKIVLKAKNEGQVFAVGLSAHENPLTIQVFSASDYRSVHSCAKNSLDFSHYPPALNLDPTSAQKLLASCPMKALSVPESFYNQWLKLFIDTEQVLNTKGLHFEIAAQDSEPSRRHLKCAANQSEKIKSALGWIAPFYEITEAEATSRPGRTLLFDLSLLEVSRSNLESLGAKLPTQIQATIQNGRLVPTLETLRSFGFSLEAVDGLGKVLAQPRLRVKPGDKASFQSGGEIPVKQSTPHSSTLSWKPYGLLLTLEPDAKVATGASEVSLSVHMELSEPDLSISVSGTPALKTRRLDSHFDLRTNEVTVLGALTQVRDAEQNQGLWGLKWIPVLGSLFSQQDSMNQNSELWFVIRPS